MEIFNVVLSRKAKRDLRKLPTRIAEKLAYWIEAVSMGGHSEVKRIPGFHDEPLKGKRKGQYSIRLSKAYRAIYIIDDTGSVHFLEVIEVNKHEY